MKRVLFLLHIAPPVHGSAIVGKYIKESEQINHTFQASYINLLASKSVNESGKINFGKLFGFVSLWIQLLKEIIHKKPALCYFALTTTGAAFYRDVLLILLLKVFKVKLVYHLHNKGISANQKYWIQQYLYQFVFKNSKVILLSKYLYSDIAQFVSKEQVRYCPNGIPETNKDLATSKPTKKVEILFLSNLIASKGILLLLAACNILKNKNLAFQCTIIGNEGDVSAEQLREKVKELNLEEFVSYDGPKYGAEKDQAYRQADIFTLPTYQECFPLVLLEASQYGLPIVSTIEGGIQEIVEDGTNGYIVPQKNIAQLASKLEILIRNEALRDKMGQAGSIRFKQYFTLKKFENRIVSILNQITSPI